MNSTSALLTDLRKSIDRLDSAFLQLLSERMRVVEKIILIKKFHGIDLSQSPERMKDMHELVEMSVSLKLEKPFFTRIMALVFQDALGHLEHSLMTEEFGADIAEFSLDDMRQNLLNLERSLCLVLAERLRVVKRIGRFKHRKGIAPLDSSRWKEVLEHKKNLAQDLGLRPTLVEEIYESIHQTALDIEASIPLEEP